MNIVCRGDSHLKKWLKIDDGVIFLRYICRKGCIINQKGLKFGRKKQYLLGILCMFAVTSFAEVWIEITVFRCISDLLLVTSFAEVWIEIGIAGCSTVSGIVTSFAEVWIEIGKLNLCDLQETGHFLRGSVD